MRIGYDAKRAFCNNTGLGNYSRMVTGGVARSEKETSVVLYSPRTRGRHEHYYDDLENVKTETPSGLWRLLPGLWRTLLGQQLRRDNIEIFHGLSHELPYGIPAGVKQVVTMHDLIVRRYPEYFKPADRLIHRMKQRHACRVADIVVAISQQTKRDLMEMMGVPEEKIRVVYQSCDPIFWEAARRNVDVRSKYGLPERYVICVGTLEERKNQLCAIRAIRQLPADIHLVIVGRPRGDYGQRILHEADERVHILTRADFTDFPALYAHAIASVYMSRFEGFGIPVLESLCCDTPVVTSNISSMPEAGGEAVLYADPDDDRTVASHLCHLSEDEAFRQEVIEKGRAQRIRFAPERVTQEMLALYHSLLHD